MPKRKSSIGEMLMKSLTSEQIGSLLTAVSASSDLNIYMDKFEKMDPDMATTVKKVLALDQGSANRGETRRLASLQRTMETWFSLWRNFDDILSEVGDEDGKYAAQDNHWESPYFDGWRLARDLEPIAEELLTLIEEVYDQVNDPDLFSKALDEIDDQIGLYPEWMGVEYGEPFVLQEKLTQCVLKWLWLSSQHERHPGRTFAEKAFSLKNSFEMVALDGNAQTDFFVRLPDGVCREIHEFLMQGELDLDLDDTYSAWHHINHHYEERFDAGKYLESCRKYLAKNWRYGQPLVENALKQKDFQKAQSFLVKTFSSYLGERRKKKWRPETSLLLIEARPFLDRGDEEIGSLLKNWAEVARRLNHPGRGAAAEFQAVSFHSPEKWDTVLKAYRRLSKPDTQKALGPLFIQWKNEMAGRSRPYFMDSRKVTDTWIHWLIDALLDGKQDNGWFLKKLDEWLSDLKANAKALKKQWHWLALLTRDLPNTKKIKEKYPFFWETALPEDDFQRDLTVSRRKGLRKMKVGPCLKTVMEIWQRHLRHIVPDPASAYKSNYEEYALWAQALLELNKDEYSVLINHWRKKHNRRRNLWREMKAMHLPVG